MGYTFYIYINCMLLCHKSQHNKKTIISDRQWLYQTCTEFGFFQTSNQDHHLFGKTVSLEYFTDLCTDVFGEL